ncbi:MAG TPA: hypothetical protein ENN80_01180, partial [Candidatus Hydrogenedentes bacterium]|nr:hypothetical protein [Candidatus Hydrogenedentota bacterium]
MDYEYSGYLARLLERPDPEIRESLDAVVFGPDDLIRWSVEEQQRQRECAHIPVQRIREGDAVRIEGRFKDIRRLDIPSDELRFWVCLSTLGRKNERFPVDVERYPIIEISYRCSSANARPAWLWTYPGGSHFALLPQSTSWRTIARRIPHGGFPDRVDSLTLRLYSTRRSIEALDIRDVRFRTMSPLEEEAVERAEVALSQEPPPREYPILHEFFPLGTFMNAESAACLAKSLGLSLDEYWMLAFEDMAKHHHNAVAIEKADAMPPAELGRILDIAAACDIKVMPMYEFPLRKPGEALDDFVDERVKPFAHSEAVMAWHAYTPPSERWFPDLLHLRPQIERADSIHPLVQLMQYPNAYPLYAAHFAASGIAHYACDAPWSVAQMLQGHLPLSDGRPFWLVAPAYVSPSDTPDWSGCPEMRLMMNLAFANGIKGWFSYLYHSKPPWITGSCRRSLTGSFLTFSDLWSELGHRMHRYRALAPLFNHVEPEDTIQKWFVSSSTIHAGSDLPEHIVPVSVYRLRGSDCNVYYIVSNDITEMTTENIEISPRSARGIEFYDLADFVRHRKWSPMARTRHLEMFPGQAHIILAAKPKVCKQWRDAIAGRLIEDDRRQVGFQVKLLERYGADLREVNTVLERVGQGNVLDDLDSMKAARDRVLDVSYAIPAVSEPRSKLVEARAALCGCDIDLCALLGRGEVEKTEELGEAVMPLARELAHLRLELRSGRGPQIRQHCEELSERCR